MGKTSLFSKSFEEKQVSAKLVKRITLVVKVRLNKNRSQGARIESLPLKCLVGLSKLGFRSWRLEQFGDKWWLILEAV
jgi:hypothetical protein